MEEMGGARGCNSSNSPWPEPTNNKAQWRWSVVNCDGMDAEIKITADADGRKRRVKTLTNSQEQPSIGIGGRLNCSDPVLIPILFKY